MERRKCSATVNIRDMNNWLKYVSITQCVWSAFAHNSRQKISVLDLGCGKGGDLYKMRGNKHFIDSYVGVDFAEKCIDSARRRYHGIVEQQQSNTAAPYIQRRNFNEHNAYAQTAEDFYEAPMFDAGFICADITSAALRKHPLIVRDKPFEMITAQFSFHYGFQSKASLDSLLNTMAEVTSKGSHFVCSLVRDEVIVDRLGTTREARSTARRKSSTIQFRNSLQCIKMKKMHLDLVRNADRFDEYATVGVPYTYYQRDSVEGDGTGVEEYFIAFSALCRLLWRKCKMRLVSKKVCADIYAEAAHVPPFKYGLSSGRRLDAVRWTNTEREVIDTFAYALFRREH